MTVNTKLTWKDLQRGDLVRLSQWSTRFYWGTIKDFGRDQPLLVVEKKYRKCARNGWEESAPQEVVVVRSLEHPAKEREFFLDQLLPPLSAEWRRYQRHPRLGEAWRNARAKHKKPPWDSFLPPSTATHYKPRRTSEQVQKDRKTEQWQKGLLKLGDGEEG